jgi:putative FmdB family regulatory protein
MPKYEYKCKACGLSEIVIRGISDKETLPLCQTCDIPLNRVYSPIGVTFNGGGFYSTDNKG